MLSSSTNLNLGKQLLYATIAGSSLIAMVSYEYNSSQIPSMIAKYSELSGGYSWESNFGVDNRSVNDSQSHDTILSFANKVVSESKDIDVDIQIAVNKIFWDLL